MSLDELKPGAWKYELAHSRVWDGCQPVGWTDWRWHLSESKPCVPEGSLRNLIPLFPPEATADVARMREVRAVHDKMAKMYKEAATYDGGYTISTGAISELQEARSEADGGA